MPGPRKIPIEIKKLRGTFDKSRAPKNLVPVVEGLPPPPPYLSATAAEIYSELQAQIVAANTHSAVDVEMLCVLALRIDEVRTCTIRIEDQGAFVAHKLVRRKNSKGIIAEEETNYRPNPAIAQRSEAARHVQSLLSEFGLSPAARAKVSANVKPKEKNPFEDF